MPRRRRRDYPGAIHHVMNRGNGRRPIFESRADVRYFLSLVARCARRGQIEVLAYSVMTTHFHLLLRSPNADLSRSLQWIESLYARYFNRTRDKCGGSYRGRFRSKLVCSRGYLRAVVWYIDRNPVDAGLVASPALYPYGSAWHYARHRGPPWLAREVVEFLACGIQGTTTFDPAQYVAAMSARASPGLRELIDRVSEGADDAPLRNLDDLVGAAPEYVRTWLARNAANADGAGMGRLVASSVAIRSEVAKARAEDPEREIRFTRKRRSAWIVMEAGLLHGASGCTLQTVADLQEASLSTAHARVRAHRAAVQECAAYLASATAVLRSALLDDFGPVMRPIPKNWV